MGFNERKSNNNWRIAAYMLSSDINKNGKFSLSLNSESWITGTSDEVFEGIIGLEPRETMNDVVNNVLHSVSCDHPRNPYSDKFWRGDVQDCYAMLKNMIYVHIMASAISTSAAFGWTEEEWDNLRSGRYLLKTYAEYKVFREAMLCESEKDMGYLYQKIMSLVDPRPTEGLLAVPICQYKFRRAEWKK